MEYAAVIAAPFGRLGIVVHEDCLVRLAFLEESTQLTAAVPASLAATVTQQLNAYFSDSTFRFSVPYALHGTIFQQRVWAAIKSISPGDTVAYQHIAASLNTAPRAVGGACGRNPVPIIIPCHRVVACNGLGGFKQSTSKLTLAIKQWLLSHEQRCGSD